MTDLKDQNGTNDTNGTNDSQPDSQIENMAKKFNSNVTITEMDEQNNVLAETTGTRDLDDDLNQNDIPDDIFAGTTELQMKVMCEHALMHTERIADDIIELQERASGWRDTSTVFSDFGEIFKRYNDDKPFVRREVLGKLIAMSTTAIANMLFKTVEPELVDRVLVDDTQRTIMQIWNPKLENAPIRLLSYESFLWPDAFSDLDRVIPYNASIWLQQRAQFLIDHANRNPNENIPEPLMQNWVRIVNKKYPCGYREESDRDVPTFTLSVRDLLDVGKKDYVFGLDQEFYDSMIKSADASILQFKKLLSSIENDPERAKDAVSAQNMITFLTSISRGIHPWGFFRNSAIEEIEV
jgi:hypothetical protein